MQKGRREENTCTVLLYEMIKEIITVKTLCSLGSVVILKIFILNSNNESIQ